MKPPVLHLHGNDGILCEVIQDDSNWPEKYLKDEVARQLDFCETCESKYVELFGQPKFDSLLRNIRNEEGLNDGYCGCGRHPEQKEIRWVERELESHEPENGDNSLKTLRMYLEGDVNA
jgi:hypothetical protein